MSRTSLPPILEPGFRAELGSFEFTGENIIRFARKFDPQPFHLDPDAARNSVFGGLCASGWHTAAIWMRKMRDYQAREAQKARQGHAPEIVSGPSPGFRNLKWLHPVYAGDTISYFYETTDSRQSNSRPGWHVVTGINSAINQDGRKVLEFQSTAFMRVEEAAVTALADAGSTNGKSTAN